MQVSGKTRGGVFDSAMAGFAGFQRPSLSRRRDDTYVSTVAEHSYEQN